MNKIDHVTLALTPAHRSDGFRWHSDKTDTHWLDSEVLIQLKLIRILFFFQRLNVTRATCADATTALAVRLRFPRLSSDGPFGAPMARRGRDRRIGPTHPPGPGGRGLGPGTDVVSLVDARQSMAPPTAGLRPQGRGLHPTDQWASVVTSSDHVRLAIPF